MTRTEWLENYWLRAKLGDRVFDIGDPRHIGRIAKIKWTSRADIVWEDTGWRSLDVPISDLRAVRENIHSHQN